MGADLNNTNTSSSLGPFYANIQGPPAEGTEGAQATAKIGAIAPSDKTTTDVVEGYQGTGSESKIAPADHPKLPSSGAMPQNAADTGNAWLDTSAINTYYSAIRDLLKAKLDQAAQSGQLATANMTSIIDTGKAKADSQMTEAVLEAVKYGAQAVSSGVQAGNSAKGLHDRVKFQNASERKAKAAEADPNRGLTPAQRTEMARIDKDIDTQKAKMGELDGAAGNRTEAQTAQNVEQRKACETEIARLEKDKGAITAERDKNVREEKNLDQRARSDELGGIEIRTQMVNQMAQAMSSGTDAVMALLIGMEKQEQTLLDTQNQINQASLDHASKAYDAAHSDFQAAVESMQQTSKQYSQSISFRAA